MMSCDCHETDVSIRSATARRDYSLSLQAVFDLSRNVVARHVRHTAGLSASSLNAVSLADRACSK